MPIRPLVKQILSRSLFDARWIMAPFYIGLIIALAILMVVFLKQTYSGIISTIHMTPSHAILMALSLIDLSLVANLLLIVALAGYDNFVSRIDSGSENRPSWMGAVDFSGMKTKLMASIIAISSIALLRTFMKMEEGIKIDTEYLIWMIAIHVTLLVSAIFLAIINFLSSTQNN